VTFIPKRRYENSKNSLLCCKRVNKTRSCSIFERLFGIYFFIFFSYGSCSHVCTEMCTKKNPRYGKTVIDRTRAFRPSTWIRFRRPSEQNVAPMITYDDNIVTLDVIWTWGCVFFSSNCKRVSTSISRRPFATASDERWKQSDASCFLTVRVRTVGIQRREDEQVPRTKTYFSWRAAVMGNG